AKGQWDVMGRRTCWVLYGVTVLVAALLPGGVSSGDGAEPAFTTFATGAHGSEVNLGITRAGVVFFGGWDHIARSKDGGRTWDVATPPTPVAADRVLVVDRSTDRVFVDDTTLGCTVLSWSDDLGQTWTTNPAACGGGATDHEKVALGRRTTLADPTGSLYPNIVYVCANALTHTPCSASFDGGRTFGPGMPAGLAEPAKGRVTPTCAFQGVPVAAPDGTLYQPRTQCGAAVDRSADNGLTWERHAVVGDAAAVSGDTPDMAITPDGTLYFFWTGADWLPRLARSTDGGRTWSEPMAIGTGLGLRSTLFPVVAAGSDGHIGLAFYGTTDAAEGWDGNPGNAPDSVRWDLFAAVSTDAAGPAPSFGMTRISTDPVQIGCLSKLGQCRNINVADYIDAEVSPDGRLHIAYVDGCPPGCTTAAASTADEGWLAVQETGPRLSQ
ncbi:MAG: glycoside hydrolase, partial [Actinobacteria bacterium]|nr:glycoside hydrolase [Actinomycetota bacterium]